MRGRRNECKSLQHPPLIPAQAGIQSCTILESGSGRPREKRGEGIASPRSFPRKRERSARPLLSLVAGGLFMYVSPGPLEGGGGRGGEPPPRKGICFGTLPEAA